MSYNDTRYDGPFPTNIPDFTSAHSHARSHHEGGNSDLFANALSFIQQRASGYNTFEDIDEQHAVKAYQALFGGGEGSEGHHDAGSVGAGAALQALKMFMSGEGGGGGEGGFDQNKLIGMAMAQAGKIWDEKESQGVSMVSIYLPTYLIFVLSDTWHPGCWLCLSGANTGDLVWRQAVSH